MVPQSGRAGVYSGTISAWGNLCSWAPGVPKDNKQAYIWYYMASMYTEKSKDDCSALIAERNRLKGTLTPDQLSETYAAFNLIWRKIDQSKEAKKIAGKKY